MDNLEEKQKEVNSQFLKAVAANKIDKVNELLIVGLDGVKADINAETAKGNSALSVAYSKNHFDMFSLLLDKGINPNIQNMSGETVMMDMVKTSQIKYLQKLLEYKDKNKLDLNVKTTDYDVTALHVACMYEQIEAATMLIEAGADVNAKTRQKASPILIAAQEGCLPLVEKLYSANADLNDVDFFGKDVLINAMYTKGSRWFSPSQREQANIDLVNFILDNGGDAKYVAPSGLSALFAATLMNKEELAIRLLNEGANPNHMHNYADLDTTPTNLAFSAGMNNLCQSLIDNNADLTIKDSKGNTAVAYGFMNPEMRGAILNISNLDPNDGLNMDGEKLPLIAVAVSGADYDSFEALINKGAVVDTTNKRFNPFKIALELGLPNFVEKMLSIPSLNIKLNNEWNIINDFGKEDKTFPLRILAEDKNARNIDAILFQKKAIEKMVKQAESNKANNIAQKINDAELGQLKQELEKFNGLEDEIKNNKLKIFDTLLQYGASVNFKDSNGRTALFYSKSADFVKKLLDNGADPFSKDNEGNIPLAWAIKTNNNEVADCLLEHIIENDLTDHESIKTILIDMIYTAPDSPMAAQAFAAGVQNSFKEGSGQINQQDEDGNTPLIVACATGQGSIAKILIDLGAEINKPNNDGEIAIFHAIADNNPILVEYLLEKGADLEHKSNSGLNAMDIALQCEHKEIINMIDKKLHPEDNVEEVVVKIKPKL